MMNKTTFAVPMLGTLLLLAACGQKAPDAAPPAPSTEPTSPPTAQVLPRPPAPAVKKTVSQPRPEYQEAPAPVVAATPPPPPPPPVCSNCGVITSIVPIKTDAEKGSGVGVVAGGLAGLVLGNQVGGGNGKTLAKVAGAAGGAYLGNKAEKKIRAKHTWDVHVKLDNGTEQVVTLNAAPTLVAGDSVRIVDGNVVAK